MVDELVNLIRETFKEKEAFIPLHEPRFKGNERAYVMDAIDSTFVSSDGKYVNEFERLMAEITGVKYAVAIVNGTNALHLSLIVAGVNGGDEVLTQPLTFIATANAISYANAIPHFVDCDKETMGLSPKKLDLYLAKISEMREGECFNKETNRKISACVPMHTFGLPLYIDELAKVCDKYGITLIEDAAEGLGSYYKGQHLGSFGKLGVFSFNGNKTCTTGGGGAIVTNDEEIAKRIKHLSTQAKVQHQWEYSHDAIGYNYRMPNLNAALGCAQLEQLPSYLASKRELSAIYFEFFKQFSEVKLVREIEDASSNYWLNSIILENRKARDEFLVQTNAKGIMTRPVWNLLNTLEMFKQCPTANLQNAEWLADRVVNITSSVRQVV
jgi:perosamine synthetase